MLQKHLKVGTFEGLFKSSTFVYALYSLVTFIYYTMWLNIVASMPKMPEQNHSSKNVDLFDQEFII